ncbi:MAG: S-layer homology domain-containing protein [Lachnospiraceae bacterium]|nr:S-layer homology domain-containing protein [Lachnospiraceae bacterium]
MRKIKKVFGMLLSVLMCICISVSFVHAKEPIPTEESLADEEISSEVEEESEEEQIEEESVSEIEESSEKKDEETKEENEEINDSDDNDEYNLQNGETVWSEKKSLNENVAVNGNLVVKADVYLNGYTLTVNGNLVSEKTIDLGEYGKLIVKGNYTQEAGDINMYYNGTVVDVSGDFALCKFDQSGKPVKGSGGLYREFWSEATCKSDSVINIGGDFIVNTSAYSPNRGTINLKGDLITLSDAIFVRWDIGSLGWGVTINFMGDSQQTIDVTQGTYLDKLGGTNKNILVKNYFSGQLEDNISVTADGGALTVNGRGINVNGYVLTINGTVIFDSEDGNFEVGENGKIIVQGDYTQKQRNMYLTYGSVAEVTGNLNVYGLDKNGNVVKGSGGIYVDWGADAVINVGKDFVFNTRGYNPEDAILNVGGNFTDAIGKEWDEINLVGEVSKTNKQTVTIGAEGSIQKLTLKSCGDFYIIPDGCYSVLEQPEHKWDNGKVTRATTKTVQGQKTFTCTVCGSTRTEKIKRVDQIFTDISLDAWYWAAVQYAYENDMMAGTGSEFKPTANLSREQLAQVLYSTEGKPEVTIKNPFDDVKDGAWYAKAVLWAKQNGIADGRPDGNFGVGNPITRQDLAIMLYKYAALKGYNLTKNDSAIEGYKDTEQVKAYAKDAMNWAVTNGIISGKGAKGASKAETRLDPAGKANRAECAAMLRTLIENNKK